MNRSHLSLIVQFCLENNLPLICTDTAVYVCFEAMAKFAGETERTIQNWVKKYRVKTYKPGKRQFVNPTDLITACPVIHGEEEGKTRKRRG